MASDPLAMFTAAKSAVEGSLNALNSFAGDAFGNAMAVVNQLGEIDFGDPGAFPDPPVPPELSVDVSPNFDEFDQALPTQPDKPTIDPVEESIQVQDIDKGYKIKDAPYARGSYRLNKTAEQKIDERNSESEEAGNREPQPADGSSFADVNPIPTLNVGFSDDPPQPVTAPDDIPDAPKQYGAGTMSQATALAQKKVDAGTAPDLETALQEVLTSYVIVPDAVQLDIAAAPEITFADLTQIVQTILADLPAFDKTAPEALVFPSAPQLNYVEQSYDETNLNAISAQLQKFFNGDYALSAVLQSAIFTQVRNKATLKELKDIRDAFDDAGARGFFEVHGELADKVATVQATAREEAEQGSQAILDKAADWQVQNFRVAVQAAISLGALLNKQYSDLASRSLDVAVAKANIRADIYEMMTKAFDVQLDVHRSRLALIKTQITERVQKVLAYAAQLEAASMSDEFKSQQLKVYGQYLRNLQSQLAASRQNLLRVGIKLAQVQFDVERYGAQIEGIEVRYTAKKQEIENYNLSNQIELSKMRSVDPLVKALSSTMSQLVVVGAAAQRKVRDDAAEEFNRNVTEKLANYEIMLQNFRNQMEMFQKKFQAFLLKRQAYKARIDAEVLKNDFTVQAAEVQTSLDISNYQIDAGLFNSKASQLVEKAKLQVAATQSAGKISSQLAAGALSALHTGATLKGEGGFSATYSTSTSQSHQVDHGLQSNSPPIVTEI